MGPPTAPPESAVWPLAERMFSSPSPATSAATNTLRQRRSRPTDRAGLTPAPGNPKADRFRLRRRPRHGRSLRQRPRAARALGHLAHTPLGGGTIRGQANTGSRPNQTARSSVDGGSFDGGRGCDSALAALDEGWLVMRAGAAGFERATTGTRSDKICRGYCPLPAPVGGVWRDVKIPVLSKLHTGSAAFEPAPDNHLPQWFGIVQALPLGSIHAVATDTSPPAPRAASLDRARNQKTA
jgi:hypothetical protein